MGYYLSQSSSKLNQNWLHVEHSSFKRFIGSISFIRIRAIVLQCNVLAAFANTLNHGSFFKAVQNRWALETKQHHGLQVTSLENFVIWVPGKDLASFVRKICPHKVHSFSNRFCKNFFVVSYHITDTHVGQTLHQVHNFVEKWTLK